MASKLSFATLAICKKASYPLQWVLTLELPLLTSNSLHSSQSLALAAQLMIYRCPLIQNWLLSSCAIYGQLCQILIEDGVAQSTHTECHYIGTSGPLNLYGIMQQSLMKQWLLKAGVLDWIPGSCGFFTLYLCLITSKSLYNKGKHSGTGYVCS